MDVYDFKQMAKTTRHDPGSTWCWTRPSFSPWDIIPSETNTEKDIIFQLQVNSKVYGCACSHLLVLLSMFRVCSMQIKDRRSRFRFVLKPQHVLHSMCWHKVDIYIYIIIIYILFATFLFHLKTLGPWPLRCLGYFGHTCCDDEGLECSHCSPVIPCLLGKVTWTMGGNRRVIDVHLKFPNFQSPGRVEDCSRLNHRIHPLQAIAKSLSMQLGSCVTSPMSSVASCRYLQTVWAAGFSKCRLW